MNKHEFHIGQQIYVESKAMYSERESTIYLATIVDVNKTSAYFVSNSAMDRHPDWQEKRWLRDRFNIKTLEVATTSWGYIEKVWLSQEDYNDYIAAKQKLEDQLYAAKNKFDSLSNKDKIRFLEDKNYG